MVDHLAGARALIVLDNCEHLLEVCASAAEALLHGCPSVTVLVTSRAPLGVAGETDWRVPSLSLPSERAQMEPVEAVAQSDAVRLFIERATKVRPNFAVDAANAPAIAQICQDLDGIPLAIELAAARVRVLGVERIAAGLGDRFRLLTGGVRSAMPRQQTLRASVDWSHDLLSDDERALRLCAALTVWWKLRGRFVLADDAYLRALDAAPAEPSALRARVLWARGYLLAYGARFEEGTASALEALEMAQSLEQVSTAARALDVLGTIQMFTDPMGAREGLEQARELARASGDEWCFVDATQILASALLIQADAHAVSVFDEAIEMIERTGYAEFAAWHWGLVGVVRHTVQGRDEEAFALYERAIAVADAVGEPVSAGYAHAYRGILRAERGDGQAALADLGPAMERSVAAAAGMAISPLQVAIAYAQASAGQLEEARGSLEEYLEQGAAEGAYEMALALSALARTELGVGLLDSAAEHAQAVAEIVDTSLENPMFRATARQALAVVALARGEATEAERLAHQSLADASEHELAPTSIPHSTSWPRLRPHSRASREAARILGAADRAREELGRVRWAREQEAVEALKERLSAELGAQALAEAIAQGGGMSTEEAIGWLGRTRGSRKRPSGGWESLTPTELQVVQFAAEGLTNPEIGEKMFIARGTVKMHLSHIYAKLDIRNRSELASLVARRTRA